MLVSSHCLTSLFKAKRPDYFMYSNYVYIFVSNNNVFYIRGCSRGLLREGVTPASFQRYKSSNIYMEAYFPPLLGFCLV